MSLSSGERVVRYRWTELLMPKEAIDQVSAIGCRQRMLSTITYADCHGNEIGDTINKLEEDMSDDESSYLDSHQEDNSMAFDSDHGSSYDNDSGNDNNDEDDDDFGGRYHQPNLALGGQQQPREDGNDDDQPVQANNDACASDDDGDDHAHDNQPGCEPASVIGDQSIDETVEENSTLEEQSVEEDTMLAAQGVGDATAQNGEMSDGLL
jgi:hypothetical protein